jgi:hypothetical protein
VSVEINFPLRTDFDAFHNFWCYISIFIHLKILLNFHFHFLFHSLIFFRSMLFDFHIFVKFSKFPPLLISSFIPLWSENLLYEIYIFLNWLRLVLWCDVWPSLENVLCVLEKNVYSVAAGWNVYISDRSIVQVQCILIDFMSGWFTHGILKSSILLYTSPFSCINISAILIFALYI